MGQKSAIFKTCLSKRILRHQLTFVLAMLGLPYVRHFLDMSRILVLKLVSENNFFNAIMSGIWTGSEDLIVGSDEKYEYSQGLGKEKTCFFVFDHL